MSVSNIALIRSLYDAFERGDIAAALAVMDDGIVWHEAENFPYADGNPYVGPQAVLEGVFARLATEWDGFAAEMPTLLDAGDHVIAIGRYRGIWPATGNAMNPQVAHVWRIADGRAVTFQQHIDTLAVARAMGLAHG